MVGGLSRPMGGLWAAEAGSVSNLASVGPGARSSLVLLRSYPMSNSLVGMIPQKRSLLGRATFKLGERANLGGNGVEDAWNP